jgi:16S rRNA (adenine(1408)-N(1))-methyltransferase
MEAMVELVRGKSRTPVSVAHVRAVASRFRHVAVDVGTGDGQWVYRMARAHPEWFCLGIDANAAALRDVSFRAGRKPTRGGVPNAWFFHASVETLPSGLERFADCVSVFYPWKRLLDGILQPDTAVIRPIGLLGKHGADIMICVNESALRANAGHSESLESATLVQRLGPLYAEAGIILTRCSFAPGPGTSWGNRVGQGRPTRSVVMTGVIREKEG